MFNFYYNCLIKFEMDIVLDGFFKKVYEQYCDDGMKFMLEVIKEGYFEEVILLEVEKFNQLDDVYNELLLKVVKYCIECVNEINQLVQQEVCFGYMLMGGVFILVILLILIVFLVISKVIIKLINWLVVRI